LREGVAAGVVPKSRQETYSRQRVGTVGAVARRREAHGITCTMSRRGNCCDNAVLETWFSTVKSEERERFESYAHAKEALFDYRS
jgi:transposase InsO family protein